MGRDFENNERFTIDVNNITQIQIGACGAIINVDGILGCKELFFENLEVLFLIIIGIDF